MKKYIYFVSFYSEFNKRVSNTQIELDCKIGDLSKVQSVEKYIAKHSLYKDPKIINYVLLSEEKSESAPLEVTFSDRYILQEILHNLSIGITLIPNIKNNIKSELMNKYHGIINPDIINKLLDEKFKI